jgi:hypothetical protein
MITRELQKQIFISLNNFPVVGILGSRQVGKTTLALEIRNHYPSTSVYLDLELPSDLSKIAEPELYLNQHRDSLVIIDEIQRMPFLFPVLRALVDQDRKPGRFLILGSASPEMIKKSSESLAGRIIYHELPPFHISEVGQDERVLQNLWLRGGYPLSYLAETDEDSLAWREAFIRTYLERDIPQLGIRVPALQLRRFWLMLSHSHGRLWNASQIAGSLGVSAPTVRHYLDILGDTFLIRQLQPYLPNLKKRLVKSPKVYIRDSGLLHTLLNIRNTDDLLGNPYLGSSWEGFALEQVWNAFPDDWPKYFYRTSAGAEIDLVIFPPGAGPLAFEMKYTGSPRLQKGYHTGFNDLDCDQGFVIYSGKEVYPLDKKVSALPLTFISRLKEVMKG